MDNRALAAEPPFQTTIADVLAWTARERPERVILVAGVRRIALAELAGLASAAAREMRERGVRPGDAVLTMLGNGLNHVVLFLGAAQAGAEFVGLGPESRGPALAHSLGVARPALAFAEPAAAARLREAGLESPVVETSGWDCPLSPAPFAAHPAAPDDSRAVLFTSGTTGPPKGVQVTERMLLASAAGCALASDCRQDDVFLMWEPMHHIGGPQVLLMALVHGARLILVPRFSAGGLWPTVRAQGVTKLHYLGGVPDILLKAPPRADDRDHPLRLAFGGGCRKEAWRAFESRFGVPIREVYGMTEASSFTTVNTTGALGSVGEPVPWFQVELLGQDGAPAQEGEITVVSRHAGLFTPGYRHQPEASDRLLRGGRLMTGDLGRRDADGNLFFLGRMTDSLRRRGENVSAWEVETALAAHPDIAECAVVGVPAEIGEHDILCFALMRDGAAFEPTGLAQWCRAHMAPHHVPRWWKPVDGFAHTPSERIRKDLLDRCLDGAYDSAPERDR